MPAKGTFPKTHFKPLGRKNKHVLCGAVLTVDRRHKNPDLRTLRASRDLQEVDCLKCLQIACYKKESP
jgi:hypothetical protein